MADPEDGGEGDEDASPPVKQRFARGKNTARYRYHNAVKIKVTQVSLF